MVNYGVHWHNNDTALCFIAGLLVGITSGARMFIHGKVIGISGIVSGLTRIVFNAKLEKIFDYDRITRLFFIGGLVASGAIAKTFLPDCFHSWTDVPMERIVISGILVGYGTTLGSGCTSGHAVCGLSSFRLRSLVATLSFMLAGFVTAMATNTQQYLPFFKNTLPMERSGAIVGVFIGICIAMVLIARQVRIALSDKFDMNLPSVKVLGYVFEGILGISFGMAMAVSNMTKPAAVISFLDLRYWNPALGFIMGGAITITLLTYLLAFKLEYPYLDVKFHRPNATIIDSKLILGSIIFGVGWGVFGACPGPAFVNLGSGKIYPLIYCCCMVFGMWIFQFTDPYTKPFFDKYVLYNECGTCKVQESRDIQSVEQQYEPVAKDAAASENKEEVFDDEAI